MHNFLVKFFSISFVKKLIANLTHQIGMSLMIFFVNVQTGLLIKYLSTFITCVFLEVLRVLKFFMFGLPDLTDKCINTKRTLVNFTTVSCFMCHTRTLGFKDSHAC